MEILPILLGGDLNCYGMALAFYETGYHRSLVLGRYRLGVTSFSRITRAHTAKKMDNDRGRCEMIREIAGKYPGSVPIVIGCTDEYASFLVRNADAFDPHFVIPSPHVSALRYADKGVFTSACERYGLHVPRSVVLKKGDAVPQNLPFSYPIVLKPARSEEYWHHPFEEMRKVWFPKSRAEAEAICERIRASGYSSDLVLQERLDIADEDNYVLTVYSDRLARVVAVAYGRVLLEEHTARGLGNHAAILTEQMPEECCKIIDFLEDVGYCGFSNFDFVRDAKTGRLYVLEMNLRQGRSNHYMTAAGINPAALVIADRVYGQKLELVEASVDVFWHSVPQDVIYSRLKDRELCRRLRMLSADGRAVSPLHIGADLSKNPLRRLFVMEHERRIRKRCKAIAAE